MRDNTCPSDKPVEIARSNTGDNQQPCDFDYKEANLKVFCCSDPSPWVNCTWYTKGDQDPPPSNHRSCSGKCPTGKVLVATDSWCSWGGTRALCCDNPSTYNDNAMTDLKNRLSSFISPLSRPASELDPRSSSSSSKKQDLARRDYTAAGGLTLLNTLAALRNAQTYTAQLGQEAFNSIYGLQYGFSFDDLSNFTDIVTQDLLISTQQGMLSALCEGSQAYANLLDLEANYGDLCVLPGITTKRKRHLLQHKERSVKHGHFLEHEHLHAAKRVFDPNAASTTGSTNTHGRPFTGALLDAIVNGNGEAEYLYSRRIDYRWRYNGVNYINQKILEVAFDITNRPDLQENEGDIFAVFHFHVEEINGNYVGVRSIGVYHSQSVIFIQSTGDYRAFPGFDPNNSDTPNTFARANQRAHVLRCEDDNDPDWLSREFLPGYEIQATMSEGSYNIYEVGRWLYQNNILVPDAFPNWSEANGFSYTYGHESASFRYTGDAAPDLSGYPHYSG